MTQTEAPPEAIEAALKLVEKITAAPLHSATASPFEWHAEARRIAAMLPKPADPAVLACREVWAKDEKRQGFTEYSVRILQGEKDDSDEMRQLVLAYRAGQSSQPIEDKPDDLAFRQPME